MKVINKADSFVRKVIWTQSIKDNAEYIESPYLIKYENTLYNSLTGEAVVVEDISADISYLIRNWFYIPKDFDLSAFPHLIRRRRLYSENGPGSSLKHSYTIFTTTSCNAACPYCFEKDFNTLTMSEKTAEDVASYILRTRNDTRPTNIEWFGGEPLCNKKVMTLISNTLTSNGVRITSGITTNGSLLPECTDEELTDIWNVKHIQLTFDDVGEAYDKTKGLPEGTFNKLLGTLERLERLKILTFIRIHYDPKRGKEPCLKVVDAVSRFNNIRPYARILYGEGKVEHYKDVLEINDYIDSKGKMYYAFPAVTKTNHCMADTNRIVAITPDGKLSPCGHYVNGANIFGSIYSSRKDRDTLKKWAVKERTTKQSCRACPLYPSCRKIVMCPAEGKCEDGYAYYQIEKIKRAMRARI